MKNKILVPTALLFILVAGQANAQLAGGNMTSGTLSRNATGAPPMAPGNPNTSTIVPEETNPNMSTGTSTETFDAMMPSTGNTAAGAPAGTTRNTFAGAPSNMNFSQFTAYLRSKWGISGTSPITQSQWSAVNPAFFDNNKPSFNSLDINRNGILDEKDLQQFYSGLYQQYRNNGSLTIPGR